MSEVAMGADIVEGKQRSYRERWHVYISVGKSHRYSAAGSVAYAAINYGSFNAAKTTHR